MFCVFLDTQCVAHPFFPEAALPTRDTRPISKAGCTLTTYSIQNMLNLVHLHQNKGSNTPSTNVQYTEQTIVPVESDVSDVIRRIRTSMADKILRPNCSLPAKCFSDLIMAAPLNSDIMSFEPQKPYSRRMDAGTKVYSVDMRAKQTYGPVIVRLGSPVEPLRIMSPISNFATDQTDEKKFKDGTMVRSHILDQLGDDRQKMKIDYNISLSARVQRPFSKDVFAYSHAIDRLSLEAFVRSANDPSSGWDDVSTQHALTEYRPLLSSAISAEDRKIGITHIGQHNHPWKEDYEIGRGGICYLNMHANFYPDDIPTSSRRAGKRKFAFKTAIYRLDDNGVQVPAHWTELVPQSPFTPDTFEPICIMVEGAVTKVETKKGSVFGPSFECSKIIIVPYVADPVLDGATISAISQDEIVDIFKLTRQKMGLDSGISTYDDVTEQDTVPNEKRICVASTESDTTIHTSSEGNIDVGQMGVSSEFETDPLLPMPESDSKKRMRDVDSYNSDSDPCPFEQ